MRIGTYGRDMSFPIDVEPRLGVAMEIHKCVNVDDFVDNFRKHKCKFIPNVIRSEFGSSWECPCCKDRWYLSVSAMVQRFRLGEESFKDDLLRALEDCKRFGK